MRGRGAFPVPAHGGARTQPFPGTGLPTGMR
jgi:hypothetical protein